MVKCKKKTRKTTFPGYTEAIAGSAIPKTDGTRMLMLSLPCELCSWTWAG